MACNPEAEAATPPVSSDEDVRTVPYMVEGANPASDRHSSGAIRLGSSPVNSDCSTPREIPRGDSPVPVQQQSGVLRYHSEVNGMAQPSDIQQSSSGDSSLGAAPVRPPLIRRLAPNHNVTSNFFDGGMTDLFETAQVSGGSPRGRIPPIRTQGLDEECKASEAGEESESDIAISSETEKPTEDILQEISKRSEKRIKGTQQISTIGMDDKGNWYRTGLLGRTNVYHSDRDVLLEFGYELPEDYECQPNTDQPAENRRNVSNFWRQFAPPKLTLQRFNCNSSRLTCELEETEEFKKGNFETRQKLLDSLVARDRFQKQPRRLAQTGSCIGTLSIFPAALLAGYFVRRCLRKNNATHEH